MLITADHGNAELMIDPGTGGPHTAHYHKPGAVILVSDEAGKYQLREGGSLRDISPTLLAMLGLESRDACQVAICASPVKSRNQESLYIRNHTSTRARATARRISQEERWQVFSNNQSEGRRLPFHLKGRQRTGHSDQPDVQREILGGEWYRVSQKERTQRHSYERKEAHNGAPMFNLKAANHQVIGTSQLYGER